MARATFVKAARKDIPQAGIKAGESYYWWKFRHGGKHYSKTPPKASQLTQSAFLSQLYDIQETLATLEADESLQGNVEDIASRLRDLADECRGNRENMPESLQDSDTGQLLEERADACEAAADELEAIDFDLPDEEELLSEAGFDDTEPTQDEGETDEQFEERKNEFEDARQTAIEDETDNFWRAKLEEVQNVSIDAP